MEKLSSKDLELVMDKFYNYKIDLLLSTTIVEAGLDIPRANTLIVYKSDYFGLAQLHQLRGRIGRSDKKLLLILLYKIIIYQVML